MAQRRKSYWVPSPRELNPRLESQVLAMARRDLEVSEISNAQLFVKLAAQVEGFAVRMEPLNCGDAFGMDSWSENRTKCSPSYKEVTNVF